MSCFASSPSVNRSEQGSALVWVFIAIMLFAALSASVGQMMRGGGQSAGQELRQLHITEILQYSDSLRRAARSMQINGVRVSAISFENSFVDDYDNNAACTSPSCRVFHPRGGGLNYQRPEDSWLDLTHESAPRYREWFFPSDSCVKDYPGAQAGDCNNDGLDNEDLLVMLPYLRKDICLALNENLGLENPGGEAPNNSGCHGSAKYNGSFSEDYMIDAFPGRPAGCFRQPAACDASSGGYYVFYRVLIGR